MASHEYRFRARSTAPPEAVFEVMADATRWNEWIGPISRASYEREGVPAPHGVGAIRVFGPRFGPVSREQVVEFDPPRRLSYTILSGFLPIRGYRSTIELVPDGTGTEIVWAGSFTCRVPGVPAFLRRTVGGFARALAAEAERRSGSKA
jgi:uncharacterized protein YndB with AHSA1/START domain